MTVAQSQKLLEITEDVSSKFDELNVELQIDIDVSWSNFFDIVSPNMFMPVTEGKLIDMLAKLFDDAGDEVFEDGMDTVFSSGLKHIILNHGENAIYALEKVIASPHADVEIVEEVLRQISHIDDRSTHLHRLALLERELELPNSRIRDAASLGIAAMDDPKSIPALQKAICNEQYGQLRKNLEEVLAQLQDTQ